jgi:hypothetical protein
VKLGETDATRRRIGPLHAVDESGDPVLGEDFGGMGELEISVGGATFVAALGSTTEIGNGYYYYNGTAGDALVGPWVEIKISGVCVEFTLREDVAEQLGGIIAGETDDDDLAVGPLRFIDADGDELGAADVAGATKQVSVNGAAWGAPAGSFAVNDDGYLIYTADPTEAAEPGWIAVRISGTCQEVVFREDVVEEFKNQIAPEIEIVSPTPGVAPGQPGGFPRSRRQAVQTPIVLRVTDEVPGLAYLSVTVKFFGSADELDDDTRATEETVYRDSQFRGKHAASSYLEVEEDGIVLHIYREGGWLGRYLKFAVDSIDGDGNMAA